MDMRWITAVIGGAGMVCATHAASAQDNDRALVQDMRDCARLADADARTACYDRTFAPTGTAGPAPAPAPVRSSGPAAKGFGAESVPVPRVRAPAGAIATPEEAEEIRLRVTRATERAPGSYVLDMSDGSRWESVVAAGPSYDPPRAGSEVKLVRGTLGGFMLRYQQQPSIRIRRLR